MNDLTSRNAIVLPSQAELVELSASLDGSQGANRANPFAGVKLIQADNDISAIEEWLSATAKNPHTHRSYKREAYRLVLWSIYFRQKPISSLMVGDLRDFEDWLANPVRHEDWLPEWRVFNGPLAERSRLQAMTILQGMFNWLVAAQYLAGNPFVLMNFKQVKENIRSMNKKAPTKFFEKDMWCWLTSFLDTLPSVKWPTDETGKFLSLEDNKDSRGGIQYWRPEKWSEKRFERIRFIVLFLYGSCVRRSELANGHMGQIYKAGEVWAWDVLGKGGKDEPVVLDDETMAAMCRYRLHRGLPPAPQYGETKIPIVARLDREASMTDWMLYHEIKSFLKHAEMYLRHIEPGHQEWLGKLAHGSAHWMRHTWASHAAAAGVSIRVTADQLRHSSTATTERVYVHSSLKQRLEDMAGIRKNRLK